MRRSLALRILPLVLLFLSAILVLAPLTWAQGEVAPETTGNPTEPGSPAEPGETGGSLDLFSLLWKGGWVMIPIALASVLALTLTIERFMSLRMNKIIPPDFLPGLKPLLLEGSDDSDKSLAYCRENPCVLSKLIQAGLLKISEGKENLQRAIEETGAREMDRMKRSLKPLSMIATVSPLLGLLGTVYGMIGAFQAASSAGVGKSDVLAQGIYEALVTTAAGLTLAIPVLIIYQVLNNRVDAAVDNLDDEAEAFVSLVVKPKNS